MPIITLTNYSGASIKIDTKDIKAMRRPSYDFMTVISSNFSFTDVIEVRETMEQIEDLMNTAEGLANEKA